MLLGITVFILAMLTGGLLAAAAPADRIDGVEPATPRSPTAGPPADSHQAAARAASTPAESSPTARDDTFAHSMILSGAIALALSIAGMVMIVRRRRLW